MAGGLIQLVAYGAQDMFLTKDPQITFFKIVYRRYTNFSTEVIPQYFTHTPDFGKRVTCILSKNGDLVRNMYLVVVLPIIPMFKDEDGNLDEIAKFAWVRRIGYAFIKSVEIEIGGELIDKQYGDWINIWNDLTVPDKINLNKMIGNVQELTDLTNGKRSYKMFIPLQFWFNRITGLSLPLVSLQYNQVKLNLEIAEFENLYVVAPTHYINIDNDFVNFIENEYIEQTVNGITSLARFIHFDIINRRLYLWRISNNPFRSVTVLDPNLIRTEDQQDAILYARDAAGNLVNAQYFIIGLTSQFFAMPRINATERVYVNRSVNFNNINLKQCFVLVEYIFLDDEERVRFSQARHEYLIEQLQYNSERTIDGLNQSFKLGFTQPCKELMWVTQLTLVQNTRINDYFNYTDSVIRTLNTDQTIGKNIIDQETILFNGNERLSLRDSAYFSQAQVYQNHTNSPSTGINVYSFALHPEQHQPSGSANMSKIDNVDLRIIVQPNIDFTNTAKLRIYGINNNVLRIANGISGLVFANDRDLQGQQI